MAAIGSRRRALLRGVALTVGACSGRLVGAADRSDPLDRPSRVTSLAAHGMLLALTQPAQGRLLAVGERGHVVISSDGGRTWQQSPTPVSVTLTAVDARTSGVVFAVGHSLSGLRSTDGGNTWVKTLDGRLLVQRFEDWAAAARENGRDELASKVKRLAEDGPDKPLLDVAMVDSKRGIAVGAYGVILVTEDGGLTWGSGFDRLPPKEDRHLNAMAVVDRTVWIVGERGLVYRSPNEGRRFDAVNVPTQASLFAVAARGSRVAAVGLRGAVVISEDEGGLWYEIKTGSKYSFTSVAADPSVEGIFWAGDDSGGVWRIDARQRAAKPLAVRSAGPIAALFVDRNRAVLTAGPLGVAHLGVLPIGN